METETVGRVLTAAKIENLKDLWDAEWGLLPPEQARSVEVSDARVDTGVTLLSVPTALIRQLGLARVGSKRVRGPLGLGEAGMYEPVRLTIQGRECSMDVVEVPDGVPVLIGQLPLGHLDFVVDPKSQRLIGNPAHDGEHVYEMY